MSAEEEQCYDNDDSSCSSGESDEQCDEGNSDRLGRGKNLKLLSVSQADKLRVMLAEQ